MGLPFLTRLDKVGDEWHNTHIGYKHKHNTATVCNNRSTILVFSLFQQLIIGCTHSNAQETNIIKFVHQNSSLIQISLEFRRLKLNSIVWYFKRKVSFSSLYVYCQLVLLLTSLFLNSNRWFKMRCHSMGFVIFFKNLPPTISPFGKNSFVTF